MTNNTQNIDLDYITDVLGDIPADELAALEAQRKTSSGKIYTKQVYYANQRSLISNWTKSEEFGFTKPGTKEELFGSLTKSQKIVGFRGIIVLSQQQALMQKYVNSRPEPPVCSLTGYKLPGKQPNDPEAYIQGLPAQIPWSGLQAWDNGAKRYIKKPNATVLDNDFLGSRGMRCADCIAQGLNKQKYTDEKGTEKTLYCDISTRIVMYLTHITLAEGETKTEYTLTELDPTLPEGVIVIIPLNKSGYKGVSLKEEKRLSGYLGYLIELSKAEGNKGNVYIHSTSVKLHISQETKRDQTIDKKVSMRFDSAGIQSKEQNTPKKPVVKAEDAIDEDAIADTLKDLTPSEPISDLEADDLFD